jgi:predicted O-methyltransferase YrrM
MRRRSSLLNKVKGFMDEDEGNRLHALALEASRLGPCLEIGSFCGKSTLYLGWACRKNRAILFSVDHHRGSEEQQPGEQYYDPDLLDPESGRIDTFRSFRRTLESAGLEDTVVPLVCRSEIAAQAWATPLSLVFIDGGPSMEAAFTDYNCWAGHIIVKGYLVIHDIFEDPREGGQAPYHVYRMALASGLFRELDRTKTLGVLRRQTFGEIPPELVGK